jgi:hypothetical protein
MPSAAQVLPVQLDQIEGVEEDAAIVPATAQQRERGQPIAICQRAPKFPRMWAFKIPWSGGFGIER